MLEKESVELRLKDLQSEKEGLVKDLDKINRTRQELQEQEQNIIQRLLTIDGGLYENNRLLAILEDVSKKEDKK